MGNGKMWGYPVTGDPICVWLIGEVGFLHPRVNNIKEGAAFSRLGLGLGGVQVEPIVPNTVVCFVWRSC